MNIELAKKYFLYGLNFYNDANYEEAERNFIKSLSVLPNRISTLINLSASQIKLRKFLDAEITSQKILSIDKNNYEAYLNLGLIARGQRRLYSSLDFFQVSIKLNSTNPEAHSNLGGVLSELQRYNEAITSFDNAIQLRPEYYEAYSNRGLALAKLQRYEEALASFDKAIQLWPDFYEAWSDRGLTLNQLKHYQEAIISYDTSININPNYHQAYLNRAFTNLLTGNFKTGWSDYEHRWRLATSDPVRHQQFPRLSSLSNISGKKLLVWCEQGYGDTIQFSRYIEKLVKLHAEVIFEVQQPLKSLLKKHFSESVVIAQGESFQAVDFQVPLLSLPMLFDTCLTNIPKNTSFLPLNKVKVLEWKDKLNLSTKKMNIGIACSGNTNHTNDQNRSINLSAFEKITDKANLFIIQKELRAKDREFLNAHPEIKFLGEEIQSFEDVAAIIDQMDLVITIDTALAHLSGALEKKTFTLIPWSPEWRWLVNRDDSPWYASMKIFRQPTPGDWGSAMEEITSNIIFRLDTSELDKF